MRRETETKKGVPDPSGAMNLDSKDAAATSGVPKLLNANPGNMGATITLTFSSPLRIQPEPQYQNKSKNLLKASSGKATTTFLSCEGESIG